MINDPIADMLTRIRNASRAKHANVKCQFSKLKEQILT
ncbi:MAG: 30S ribosomal protein S8, partial [Leptonema sp. (in: Bacteria)]|nr:30S ribosomal protein S8 [Leptonema sp. (in: bacteria)]